MLSKRWIIVAFYPLILLLISGPSCVGLPKALSLQEASVPENHVREKSFFTDTDDSVFPPKILTAAHLSSLRDLLSDKKITVRLGLRIRVSGPRELLDPQLLHSMYREQGIYNIGKEPGLFSMRVVGLKRLTPHAHSHPGSSQQPQRGLVS